MDVAGGPAARVARWLVGVVAVAATVGAAGCSSERESPESRLRAAASASPAARYRFEEVPDAEGLAACFSSRRRVRGAVDRLEGVAAVAVDADERPIALIQRGRSYVRREVLQGWSVPTPWAMVPAELTIEARAALSVSLGESVAAYVMAFDLPPDAITLARSALEAKLTVTSLGTAVVSGVRTELIQVETNAERLREGNEAIAASPILTFALDRSDRIVRVAAKLPSPDPDALPTGYHIEFLPFTTSIALPEAADVTAIAQVAIPAQPQPPTLECTIGPATTRSS